MKRLAIFFITLIFLCSTVSPVSVSADSGEIRMELKDAMLLPGDNQNTVAFTLDVHNGKSGELDFNQFWVRLQTKAGSNITVNLLPQDKDKTRIPSDTSQSYSFYAKVSSTTELQDLVFKLVQLDFSVAGFERLVDQVSVPNNYSFVTSVGSDRNVRINGIPVSERIDRIAISQNEEFYLPSIFFEMENEGTNGVKLPDYTYYLRTESGQMYPLQSTVFLKDAGLQPLVNKEGTLSGSIPREAGTGGWQLVIAQTITDNGGSVQLPVAFFQLPAAVAEDVSIGNDYEITGKAGTYTVQLTSLQRLPWEDQDILSASITLKNDGSETLPLPDLKAYFKLDDAVTVEAKLIRTDRVISLLPGKEITLQLAGQIPYASEFQSIKLILQEKEADNKVNDLLTFYHNKELMEMPVIPANTARKLTDIGQSAAYTVQDVHTFQGDSADLYAVKMDAQNLEKRLTGLRKQLAQFKAADGTVFPAKISEVQNKLTPGGKAQQYIWTMLPKDYPTEGMQLIVGDEIPNEAGKQQGYVNAASFGLPEELKEPKAGFTDLEIDPYTVTLGHFGTQANYASGTVKLDFNYELKKNALVEADMKEHKLIVELKDDLAESGKEIVVSQTYDLEGTDPAKSLQLGLHDALITYTNKDKIYNIKDMKTYQLNVYHQFQNGQKKLLATKELEWFIYAE